MCTYKKMYCKNKACRRRLYPEDRPVLDFYCDMYPECDCTIVKKVDNKRYCAKCEDAERREK
ncbi:hypothetical protein WAI453_011923 [Rhynchosporium graminicola]